MKNDVSAKDISHSGRDQCYRRSIPDKAHGWLVVGENKNVMIGLTSNFQHPDSLVPTHNEKNKTPSDNSPYSSTDQGV